MVGVQWYAVQDGEETVIYANFQGKDPRKEKVEINVRRECFMPSEEHVDFITLSGFYIEKQLRPGHRRQLIRMVWLVRIGPMDGSLRTVKSSTVSAVEFPLANIMMQK